MVDIRTDRRRWRLVVLPLGAVALMGLAACGTSTGTGAASSDSTSASASAGAEPTDQNGPGSSERAAYRTCLANNGVTLPSRQPRPNGSGGPGDGNGAPPSGAPAAPPNGGQGGGGMMRRTPGEAPPGVDATTWAAAQKACASLAPTRPMAPPTSAGS